MLTVVPEGKKKPRFKFSYKWWIFFINYYMKQNIVKRIHMNHNTDYLENLITIDNCLSPNKVLSGLCYMRTDWIGLSFTWCWIYFFVSSLKWEGYPWDEWCFSKFIWRLYFLPLGLPVCNFYIVVGGNSKIFKARKPI